MKAVTVLQSARCVELPLRQLAVRYKSGSTACNSLDATTDAFSINPLTVESALVKLVHMETSNFLAENMTLVQEVDSFIKRQSGALRRTLPIACEVESHKYAPVLILHHGNSKMIRAPQTAVSALYAQIGIIEPKLIICGEISSFTIIYLNKTMINIS